MRKVVLFVLSMMMFPYLVISGGAQHQKPVYIGLDGEFGYTGSTSAEAIRQGILLALAEINHRGVLGGRPMALLEKANHSVPSRSINNIKEFASNPDMVAVYCGRFSPTVLEALPTIHEQKMLLLDPWAAADAIIDNNFVPNYAFRLSMRDSWGIPALLQEAERQQRHQIGLLLLNTSWGRSSLQAAEQHIAIRPSMRLVGRHWFNWDDRTFIAKYTALVQAGAEAIVLVANANEAAVLLKEMAQLPKAQRLPIYSHWGVSGGDLAGMAGQALQEVEFYVAQTFTFVDNTDPKAQHVLRAAQQLFHLDEPQYLPAQVGLAHAYDLTHILARAIDQAGSTDRTAIRDALEHLGSYDGLMRSYAPPFTPTRHDALSAADVFVGRYIHDNALIPVQR